MNSNIPHRVTYSRGGSCTSSRVFASLQAAQSFAETQKTVLLIQPASEPPPDNSSNPQLMSAPNRTIRIKCECGSGRNRLTSDQYCAECSGSAMGFEGVEARQRQAQFQK